MTGTETQPTHSVERLARLLATQRVAEARAELDALVVEQPEVAAQWYIVARLLLCGGADRYQQIRDGLIPLGLAPQRAFQQTVRRLDTLQQLELLLAQVRQARATAAAQRQAQVRAGLTRFLDQVQRHKQTGNQATISVRPGQWQDTPTTREGTASP
ncbi:MAG: hypothetical protein H7835_18475 [Magnetococcus sp. XQGC-1]